MSNVISLELRYRAARFRVARSTRPSLLGGLRVSATWRLRPDTLAARTDVDLKRAYFTVLHRRGRPKAKVALARKLLVRLYIMLRDQIDYNEFRRRGPERRSPETLRPAASPI
jgi:hypothetical protein